MGFFDDIGKNIGDFGKNLGNFFGSMGGMGVDPGSASQMAPSIAAGSADIGSGGGGGVPVSMPSSSSLGQYGNYGGTGSNPYGDSAMSPASSNSGSDGGLNQNIMALAGQLMQGPDYSSVINALGNFKTPSYADLAHQNYAQTVAAAQQNQANVNARYGQVGQMLADLYGANSTAASLGDNNVLQAIARDEGSALQDTANSQATTLSNMKNAQLAERANLLERGGLNPADAASLGDFQKIDPSQVAEQNAVNQAASRAANAQSAAADRTQLNNEMARALQNQGNIAQGQLQNQNLAYNTSVGKYLTDLASQENQLEMQAHQQDYQNALNRLMAGVNMQNQMYNDLTQRIGAVSGNRGLPEFMQANAQNTSATANLLKALQAQGANGVDPFQSAVQRAGAYGPQVQQELTGALGSMQLTPGTKPTFADLYQWMSRNNSQNIPADILYQAAQDATASKALPSGQPDMYELLGQINNL